jgi:hypothetical protein
MTLHPSIPQARNEADLDAWEALLELHLARELWKYRTEAMRVKAARKEARKRRWPRDLEPVLRQVKAVEKPVEKWRELEMERWEV